MALFALLVQFAVSFGHVHLKEHDYAPSSAVSDAVAAVTQHSSDEDHADHQACAICILNQMVGSAQTAAPPAVLLTLISRAAEQPLASKRIAAEPQPSAFRSRAPPIA